MPYRTLDKKSATSADNYEERAQQAIDLLTPETHPEY
jgi:hypothetical protein